jgi:methyl-accepting chemotaxis protein
VKGLSQTIKPSFFNHYFYMESAMIRPFQSAASNLKLGQKLTLLLVLVFIGGVIASGITLSRILNTSAQNEITSQALMLMETMNSVRDYTNTQVKPELADKLETEFLPQTVPAYAAREVFEKWRSNQTYKEFFYKEATLNPTNLRDKADGFESTIVERFRQDAALKEQRGFYNSPSGKLFYVARPLPISKESCLECHSTPDAAPPSMIERYGTANGFGWKLNEIVGAQMIFVPSTTVLQNVQKSFMVQIGVFTLIFAATVLTVNFWLKHYVVRPLNRIAKVAEAVSMGNTEAEFERTSNDEVGSLADAFSRMKMSLMMAIQRLDQYRSGRRSSRYSVDKSTDSTDPGRL